MRVGELREELEGWDQGMEVVIRVNLDKDGDEGGENLIESLEDLDGEYLDVVDGRSVLVENGRVVIIADLVEA